MVASDLKNIHFKVPRPLYEEFKTAFPEVGMMKTLFTQFMQVAVEEAEERNCFVESVYKKCRENLREEEE